MGRVPVRLGTAGVGTGGRSAVGRVRLGPGAGDWVGSGAWAAIPARPGRAARRSGERLLHVGTDACEVVANVEEVRALARVVAELPAGVGQAVGRGNGGRRGVLQGVAAHRRGQ